MAENSVWIAFSLRPFRKPVLDSSATAYRTWPSLARDIDSDLLSLMSELHYGVRHENDTQRAGMEHTRYACSSGPRGRGVLVDRGPLPATTQPRKLHARSPR